MTRCPLCGEGRHVSAALGVCAACLRSGSPRAAFLAERAHRRTRAGLALPAQVPTAGVRACPVCANGCRPEPGEVGLCGARRGTVAAVEPVVGTPRAAAVSFWHDPLPTNCGASFVCGGSARAERGRRNLAVAYHGCTFDCLYCQSFAARAIGNGERHGAGEVAAAADDGTTCLCFFGGDPTPQLAHAVAVARLARAKARSGGRPLRICFETNGAMRRELLRPLADLALESGGCIKVDLKAHHPGVHRALTGSGNERTLENFAYLAARRAERPDPPLAVAATPLVPGYVDVEEVRPLARFVASLGADIPYVLLGFFSCFELADLPNTSWQQARRCLRAARQAGLTRARLGNAHLLRDAPEERRGGARRAT